MVTIIYIIFSSSDSIIYYLLRNQYVETIKTIEDVLPQLGGSRFYLRQINEGGNNLISVLVPFYYFPIEPIGSKLIVYELKEYSLIYIEKFTIFKLFNIMFSALLLMGAIFFTRNRSVK